MYLIAGVIIFVSVFYLIITEKVPAPWATMGGGMAMALIGIMNEHDVLQAIYGGLEIIFLLIGMMIIVHLISETGVFQWFAIKVAQFVRGNPFKLMALLAIVTGIASAFLDNVTTILLMIPVTTLLAEQLKISPYPFIMTEIMAANIGGMATLIGDPPQLIIGSEGKLGFNDFLMNTSPLAIIGMIILILNVYFIYGRKMEVPRELRARIMELDPSRTLKDKKLLKRASIVFLLVIAGFLMNGFIHRGLSVIAISGAIVLVVMNKIKPEDILKHVEWDTLFFFMGLFVLVRGIENVNLINIMGEKIVTLTNGHLGTAVLAITTFSSALSAIIGNVASAATISKIIHIIHPTFSGVVEPTVLWWALSIGTCLGGNFTILASASNIIAVSAAEKAGCKITFLEFMKLGTFITFQTIIVGIIYLKLRYM